MDSSSPVIYSWAPSRAPSLPPRNTMIKDSGSSHPHTMPTTTKERKSKPSGDAGHPEKASDKNVLPPHRRQNAKSSSTANTQGASDKRKPPHRQSNAKKPVPKPEEASPQNPDTKKWTGIRTVAGFDGRTPVTIDCGPPYDAEDLAKLAKMTKDTPAPVGPNYGYTFPIVSNRRQGVGHSRWTPPQMFKPANSPSQSSTPGQGLLQPEAPGATIASQPRDQPGSQHDQPKKHSANHSRPKTGKKNSNTHNDSGFDKTDNGNLHARIMSGFEAGGDPNKPAIAPDYILATSTLGRLRPMNPDHPKTLAEKLIELQFPDLAGWVHYDEEGRVRPPVPVPGEPNWWGLDTDLYKVALWYSSATETEIKQLAKEEKLWRQEKRLSKGSKAPKGLYLQNGEIMNPYECPGVRKILKQWNQWSQKKRPTTGNQKTRDFKSNGASFMSGSQYDFSIMATQPWAKQDLTLNEQLQMAQRNEVVNSWTVPKISSDGWGKPSAEKKRPKDNGVKASSGLEKSQQKGMNEQASGYGAKNVNKSGVTLPAKKEGTVFESEKAILKRLETYYYPEVEDSKFLEHPSTHVTSSQVIDKPNILDQRALLQAELAPMTRLLKEPRSGFSDWQPISLESSRPVCFDRAEQSSSFLTKLPGEIRERIYEYVYDNQLTCLFIPKGQLKKWAIPSAHPPTTGGVMTVKKNGMITLSRDPNNPVVRYPAVLGGKALYKRPSNRRTRPVIHDALLRVSCQLYHEAAPALYRATTFFFQGTKTLRGFLENTALMNLDRVRVLHLDRVTPGAPDSSKFNVFMEKDHNSFDSACALAAERMPNLTDLRFNIYVSESPMFLEFDQLWVQPFLRFSKLRHRHLQNVRVDVHSQWSKTYRWKSTKLAEKSANFHRKFGQAIERLILTGDSEYAIEGFDKACGSGPIWDCRGLFEKFRHLPFQKYEESEHEHDNVDPDVNA